ncbi:N-acetylmuramoyl-L-alanine amidase [Nakamurella leprariae]|uniref:N-acetylmuramoyl-L-alanine amidase n=1 Tax=Nakamurella leprariae TaxID=2803911 RepID=A0A938YKW5_9ACTN|nr:N-acetylmuramoyl-L-alanine amidase [Nakamurella leprariae]MBM9469655.1 N-acetylmuramoyl-L-alanine amidase [Nakamurella leprariae]
MRLETHPGRLRSLLAVAAAAGVLLTGCGSPGDSVAGSPTVSSGSPVATSSTTPDADPSEAVTVPDLVEPTSGAEPPSSPSSVSPTSETAPPPVTPTPEPAEPTTSPSLPTAEPTPSSTPAPAPAPADRGTGTGALAGRVVVIDPGHNGGNGASPGIINAPVDAGFGQTKPCNTTGTSTDDGYAEARFNWEVATLLVPMLEEQGITVVLTRDSNDGVGPCVNERAAIGNQAGADAVVSIHGDGDAPSAEGFYVMTAERAPADSETAAASAELAQHLIDGLAGAGLSPNNHLGSDGWWARGDLAGLNLSTRPTVMIEAGNMRNAADAGLMSSAEGQALVARGLAAGIVAYLQSR